MPKLEEISDGFTIGKKVVKGLTKEQFRSTPVQDIAASIGSIIRAEADILGVEDTVTREQLEEVWMKISHALSEDIENAYREACEDRNSGRALVREYNAEAIRKIRSTLFDNWQKKYGIFPGCPVY